MKVLIHSQTRQQILIPTGFSFTTFFFGVFVPLFRGDIFGFLILLVAAICTGGISWFIVPFFYNSMYESGLRKQGYVDQLAEDSSTSVSKLKERYFITIKNKDKYSLVRLSQSEKGMKIQAIINENIDVSEPPLYYTEDDVIDKMRHNYEEVRLFNDRPSAEEYIFSKKN